MPRLKANVTVLSILPIRYKNRRIINKAYIATILVRKLCNSAKIATKKAGSGCMACCAHWSGAKL